MILTAFHGFCMALADSVPGVSGGTIAFILGFCERFLDALHGLFARNIYFMSSLFLGLTACSIPFVALSERKALLARPARHGWFLLLGVAIVVGLTLLRSGTGTLGSVSYTQLSLPQFGYLFLSGAVAITAEKSQQAVEDLVKKGELTVQQGKSLNQELSRKAKEAAQETTDGALRAFLEALSDEDRAAYAAKVAQMAADIEAAKVTVDVEDGVEEGPAAQAESAEGSAE